MFLAIAINDTISKGQNYKSGVAILKNMDNKAFASKIIRYTLEASIKNQKNVQGGCESYRLTQQHQKETPAGRFNKDFGYFRESDLRYHVRQARNR